jgi:hypothetical protein
MNILDRLLCRWLGEPQPYGTPGARVVNIRRGGSATYLRRFRLMTDESELRQTVWQKRFGRFVDWVGERVVGHPGPYNLYLHEVFRSDDDLDPHDHPWVWGTLILWGGYVDELWEVPADGSPRRIKDHEVMKPGTWRRRAPGHLHRLRLFPWRKKPTWTLVFIGPRKQPWGFQTADVGWMPFEQYMRERQGIRV